MNKLRGKTNFFTIQKLLNNNRCFYLIMILRIFITFIYGFRFLP